MAIGPVRLGLGAGLPPLLDGDRGQPTRTRQGSYEGRRSRAATCLQACDPSRGCQIGSAARSELSAGPAALAARPLRLRAELTQIRQLAASEAESSLGRRSSAALWLYPFRRMSSEHPARPLRGLVTV